MAAGPRADTYDVVVVGSGLGGLSAAALLGRAGLRVLVVERAGGPGGYARAFARGPYRFDAAIRVTYEAAPGRLTANLLEHLGVADRCTFLAVGDPYGAVLPGLALRPGLGEEFTAAHVRAFPHEAEGLRRYMAMRRELFAQMARMPQQIDVTHLDAAMAAAPLVFRYRTATLAEVLDEHLTDDRLKAALGAIWPYLGSPPARLSFLVASQMLELMVDDGRYAQGTFQTLVDALVVALERTGGEVLTGTEVEAVVVEDGRAAGVRLADGTVVRSRVIVSNVDARQTFEQLVGTEHLPPRFVKRLRRAKPSHSAVVLYTAYRGDPAAVEALAHETFLYRHWDHDETQRDILAGRPGGVWVSFPTVLDPSLAPPGVHLGTITSLAPAEVAGGWDARLPGYADELLAMVGDALPDLRGALEVVETATPRTLEKATRNSAGAIYGWENIPAQTASKRLDHRTPLPGLLLSGHWSSEGSSSFRVLLSGIETAGMVARDLGADPVPELRGENITALHAPERGGAGTS